MLGRQPAPGKDERMSLNRICGCAWLLSLVLSAHAWALPVSQTATPAPAPQKPAIEAGVHPVSGRRIAQVMSHEGADWLDRPEREREEQPDRALDAIGVHAGDVVADVGAGTGYYTVRLARRVIPTGRVYATDIQAEMLTLLQARLAREHVSGVKTVLATADDTGLPVSAIDLILLVDVYHELSEPQRVLQQLKRALRPGGRLVLLEYRKEDPGIAIRPDHKMSVAEARLEVEHEGYKLDRVIDVLPMQHILIFRPN
jgi:ubiquinone/menaquinone biosynthesis C-methylase UbiE